MKPRIKSFVYFDQHPDGIFFRSGSEAFVLRGKGIYPIAAKLVERLDGRTDLSELSSALPEPLHRLLNAIVQELLKREFLIDCDEGIDQDEVDEAQHAQFPQVLAYLADHVGQPMRAFRHWQAREITLIGNGRIAAAAKDTLAKLGAANICELADIASLEESPDATRDRSAAFIVAIDVLGEDIDVAALSAALPASFFAGQYKGQMVVAPLQALERVFAAHDQSDEHPVGPKCALAGNLLAHELFLRETGMAAPDEGPECKLITHSLRVQTFAPAPESGGQTQAPTTDRQLSEFEEFWASLEPLFAEPSGLFRLNSVPEVSQLPLFHRQILVNGAHGQTVRRWGFEFEDSSKRALRSALELHAANSHPGDVIVRAGFSRQEAQARLALTKLYSDPSKRELAKGMAIASQALEGEALVLHRLAQKLGSKSFDFTVRSWPQVAGAIAEISVQGNVVVWAAEANGDDAITEALGEYCSMLQNDALNAHGVTPQPLPDTNDTLELESELASFGLFVAASQLQPEPLA